MFGKLIGNIVAAPVRALEVTAGAVESGVDSLYGGDGQRGPVSEAIGDAARGTRDGVEYVINGDDDE